MPIKKDIVYPIFLECLEYTSDKFWENIFEDLAYAKTPYGTYISKDFLCCKYKKKEFTYKIVRKDPKILYEEIYNLLKNKLGLISGDERLKKKKQVIEIENKINIKHKDWKDIKKKNIKESLIELYVVKMKIKYSLTLQQARYLLSIIYIAIVFKVISTKDIEYEDGIIININGISFLKKQIVLERELYNLEINFSPEIVLDKTTMQDSWEKYLKELKKSSTLVQ